MEQPVECPVPLPSKERRDVRVESLNYGYIVRIDCHSFAIETVDKLNKKLNEYFLDPEGVERKWNESKKL